MRWLFITNFCPHYRVRTFELLSQRGDVEFAFFSAGDEWYWDQRHGTKVGDFPHEYLRGVKLLPGVRITPKLIPLLWRFDGDAILKCITGRFALPVSLLIARLRRKPFVLWTGIWQHPRTIFHRMTFPITWLVYMWADSIVVYGDHVKRYLTTLGVKSQKIFVAHHAVDNSVYSRMVPQAEQRVVRERYGIAASRVVLFVGRLEPVKGVDVLLTAFSQASLTDSQLVIIGDGSLREELVRQAEVLGLNDRVRFLGYLGPEEATVFYAVADLLVLPSVSVRQGKELWGLVVNEAMNQGTPILATTAVGAAAGGLVKHGENGEVVAERSIVELRDAMRRIILDDDYRRKLSDGAAWSIASWDNERMVKGFEAAVRYAVGRRTRGRTSKGARV